MKRPIRILARTAAVLLGIPALIYLGWLSGNLSDDELDPAVARLIAAGAPPQIDARDNAYFDLLGIGAPEGEDAHAWGQARFRELTASDGPPGGTPPAPVAQRKSAIDAAKIPCAKTEECLAEVAGNPYAAQRALAAEATPLRRLDAVLESNYQEPYRAFVYHSEFAAFAPPMTALKLAQARVALLAAQGRHEEALRQWGRLTAFADRQAAGSYSLLAKMIAIAALHRQHVLLAEYLKTYPGIAAQHAALIMNALPPQSRAELTLAPALESEIAVMARSFTSDLTDIRAAVGSDLPAPLAGLFEPFFKPKATVNMVAGQMRQWVQLDALEGDAYRAARATLARQAGEEQSLWHYRNPIGKILAGVAEPEYSSYFYRRDNLAAERRLLRFGIGLLADGKCDAALIKAAVANHRELAHPYTGALPAWNDQRRSLSHAVPDGVKGGSAVASLELSFDAACR